MENRLKAALSPCQCDTGRYCHRHCRYTGKGEPACRAGSILYGIQHDDEGHQKCGGGIRIIRNAPKE